MGYVFMKSFSSMFTSEPPLPNNNKTVCGTLCQWLANICITYNPVKMTDEDSAQCVTIDNDIPASLWEQLRC